jgi:hypothetical protein
VSEDRPPEAESFWSGWGKTIVLLVLGIVGVLAAMGLALIVIF